MTDSLIRASASLISCRSPIETSPPNITNLDPSELWEFSIRASSKLIPSASESCSAPHDKRKCELQLEALNWEQMRASDARKRRKVKRLNHTTTEEVKNRNSRCEWMAREVYLFEFSSPIKRRPCNKSNLVMVIIQHSMKDFVHGLAGKSLQVSSWWFRNFL